MGQRVAVTMSVREMGCPRVPGEGERSDRSGRTGD